MISSKASVVIVSRYMLKRVGESRHPCRTSTVVRNQSPMLLLKRTPPVAFTLIEYKQWLQYRVQKRNPFFYVVDCVLCRQIISATPNSMCNLTCLSVAESYCTNVLIMRVHARAHTVRERERERERERDRQTDRQTDRRTE